ncbi:hypothetical protein ACFQ49_08370 [Kroppenstedtia eburnea]|uniref:Uncharacterized protein n=1 Tax=Kroppenstedtia eburnea TaxID=714067 RepID=A0A1N7IKF7_9BACL|nr:hypothetical protein [Kroppenstedtia eburnea]EGK14481.1 DNA polymerase III, gamma/tau subunit DnaX [Desmospora sp. 8437]QKI81894.1 hypothetical protein GXN75_07720 [Kroppenstedtia eburnea]SIS37557.1 hypothetical protein SAMN05421790_10121 [Kroppenstedtia eburnea]
MKESDEIITSIDYHEIPSRSLSLAVDVYVKEEAWADMRKSQKLSLAVVTEKKVQDAVKDFGDPRPQLYIRSDVAEDILAKKKLLELNPNANPWKIIR